MLAAIVSALVGALLAAGLSVGLVYSQTKAPSSNPIHHSPILTYGQPAT